MNRAAALRPRLAPARGSRRLLVAALAAVMAAALVLGLALADALRASAAALALFAVCGYAPTRLLAPRALQASAPLLVLPVGAAVSGLALTLPGMLGAPLPVSLALVLALGAAAGVVVRRRLGPLELPQARLLELAAPTAVALALGLLVLAPLLRVDGFAGVIGGNGDAHLATGTAELLQHAPPFAERPDLPIDHFPPEWRSKVPIYYVLAAVSSLSGLDPVQTLGSVIAVLAALAIVGFFLLARYPLGAAPAAALLGMVLVALDRLVLRLALDPFYNQLWALLALPFVLLFAWEYLRRPGRRSFALLAIFATIAVLAYPLLAPFPALFIAVGGARRWREVRSRGERPGWISALRLPRARGGRRSLLLWVPLAVLATPVALVLVGAVLVKAWSALQVALPGGDLGPWGGRQLPALPLNYFLGLPLRLELLSLAVLALTAVGLRRAPREAAVPLGSMLLALLLAAGWFQLRGGHLFHFRALGFFGPTALLVAGLGLASLIHRSRSRTRMVAVAGATVLVGLSALVGGKLVWNTRPTVTPAVWALRSWSDRLPRGASVRVDTAPIVIQMWAGYMLAEHPLTASDPLRAFFPYPPVGRRADYLIVNRGPRPRDADGAPVLRNEQFALYRMSPDVRGPDVSSRAFVDP